MKKALAVLLAVIMAATLVACKKGKNETDEPPEEQPTANNSQTPAPQPPQQSATIPPPEPADEEFGVRYIDFGYTPSAEQFSRPEYHLAHIVMVHTPQTQMMVNLYGNIGTKMNFTITSYSSYRDADLFINLIETTAELGMDGMIIDATFALQDRVFEITDELGIIYMPGLSTYATVDGKFLRPSAALDNYRMGSGCLDYMLDNYAKHTGVAFVADNIGLITVEYGANKDYNARRDGAADAYKAAYPRQMNTNYFNLDTADEPTQMTADAAYSMVAETVTENTQITGWLVFGVAEDFADGASKALEDMGYGETSLVTCVSVDKLAQRWDAGYDGCWVACADTPAIQWAHATICGLMQLIEGKANPQTLWQQYKDSGQDYTVIMLPFSIVDKANHDDYTESINQYINRLFT